MVVRIGSGVAPQGKENVDLWQEMFILRALAKPVAKGEQGGFALSKSFAPNKFKIQLPLCILDYLPG